MLGCLRNLRRHLDDQPCGLDRRHQCWKSFIDTGRLDSGRPRPKSVQQAKRAGEASLPVWFAWVLADAFAPLPYTDMHSIAPAVHFVCQSPD
jgi:hypothetical protein